VSKAGGLCVFSELGRKRKQVGERKRPEMKCVLSALARSPRCGGGRRNQQPDPVYIDAGKRGSGRRVGNSLQAAARARQLFFLFCFTRFLLCVSIDRAGTSIV
jgi:hypothetical protein